MSDKPLSDRLQVKNGRTLAVLDAPAGLVAQTGLEATAVASDADVVLSFVANRAGLEPASRLVRNGKTPLCLRSQTTQP